LTVDIDTGVYLLGDRAGVVYAGGHVGTDRTWDLDSPGAFSDALTDHWKARLRRRGGRLWDGLADARVTDGWTGPYAMTPSNRPIINRRGTLSTRPGSPATGYPGTGTGTRHCVVARR
jgi:glycine/D-amino acid oxidase-like deaminating enzyme